MRLRRYRPITGLLAALVLGCNAPPADNPADDDGECPGPRGREFEDGPVGPTVGEARYPQGRDEPEADPGVCGLRVLTMAAMGRRRATTTGPARAEAITSALVA